MICHRRYRVAGVRTAEGTVDGGGESRASNYECAAEGAATRAREEKRRAGGGGGRRREG